MPQHWKHLMLADDTALQESAFLLPVADADKLQIQIAVCLYVLHSVSSLLLSTCW